jgi:hypothetical protein
MYEVFRAYTGFGGGPENVLLTVAGQSVSWLTDVVGEGAEAKDEFLAIRDAGFDEDAIEVGAEGAMSHMEGRFDLFVTAIAEDQFDDGDLLGGEFKLPGDLLPFIDRQGEWRQRMIGHGEVPQKRGSNANVAGNTYCVSSEGHVRYYFP